MFPLLAIPAILKGAAGIGQMIAGSGIHPEYHPYEVSKYAKQRLGLAQGLFNARSAGASAEERNIYNNQANTTSAVTRNATDSSQALAMLGGIQTQSNNAFNDLGIEEDKNKYNLLDNLNSGYNAMTAEDEKVYQDKMRKYEIDTGQKNSLISSGMNNAFGAVNDFVSGTMQQKQQNEQNDFYNKYLTGMAGGLGGR